MTSTENKIGFTSKLLLTISSILLIISIFTPIWRIELNAPQYPEGLSLLIYANKLGGQVEIINGLNHYIGMKTLHAEEFVEFTVLPYIIGFYALACLVTAILGNKKLLYILFGAFVLFGVIAMVDFWRWEYNYGHNLDPNAAIVVPGMAYQPPLIGFKQLLNFGAYSIPDKGGWLFVTSGVLLAISIAIESSAFKKRKALTPVLPILFAVVLSGCETSGPEAVKLNTDKCDNCGMTISDPKFAAEIVTKKGRIYKFDDISCLLNYKRDNKDKMDNSKFYISDFLGDDHFISTESALFIEGESINSPMGGNIAAFSNKDSAAAYTSKYKARSTTWTLLNQ